MKLINAEKLEKMGVTAVKNACLKHAETAIALREAKGPRYDRLCSLLDQCAAVARKMRAEGHPI